MNLLGLFWNYEPARPDKIVFIPRSKTLDGIRLVNREDNPDLSALSDIKIKVSGRKHGKRGK